ELHRLRGDRPQQPRRPDGRAAGAPANGAPRGEHEAAAAGPQDREQDGGQLIMPNATAGSTRAAPRSTPSIPRLPRERPAPCGHARRWLTLAVVLTASFLGTLDFFIINLALPSIQADLHASFAQVQLVIAGYGLAYAVCLITGGRLGDIYGRKRVFLGG